MWTLLLATALASDPTAVVTDAGVVRGTVALPVPPEVLVRELADPGWVATLYDGGTEVKVIGPDGPCLAVDYVSPNPIVTVSYRVRHCTTPTGATGALIASEAFSAYATSWVVVPKDGGLHATYEVDLTTSLFIPQSFVRSATRTSVKKLMGALDAWGAAWAAEHGGAGQAPATP